MKLLAILLTLISLNCYAQVTYNETFEGATVWPGVHKQFGTPHAFTVVDFGGNKVGRFERRAKLLVMEIDRILFKIN